MTSKVTISITRERAAEMLDDYADLPIERHIVAPLQRRVLELRDNFTAYDAFYVALAEALDLPLLTDDGKFARSPSQPTLIETWSS